MLGQQGQSQSKQSNVIFKNNKQRGDVAIHHCIKNAVSPCDLNYGGRIHLHRRRNQDEYQVIPPDLRCQLESCNTWAGENCMGYYLPDYEDCMLTAEPLIQNRNVTVCAKEALTKEPQPGILVVPGGYIK